MLLGVSISSSLLWLDEVVDADQFMNIVFTCVSSLAILDRLDIVGSNDDGNDLLGWWLAERQLPNGGLNGRPEKLEDVRLYIKGSLRCLADEALSGLLLILGPLISLHSP